MNDEYEELRRLVLSCRAEANCPTCDASWDKIQAEVERVFENRLAEMMIYEEDEVVIP